MDCLPSRYSFTHRMMKQRFKKIFILIHTCWNTSTPLEKLKKKKKKARKKRKRKEKLSPMTFPNDQLGREV